MAVGSDSHVCRNWAEELRWLEYGQRLNLQRRNVGADPASGQTATAARVFQAAVKAGGSAAGHALWGLKPGARADLLVLDTQASGLLGIPESHTLDALIFGCDAPAIRDVWVAGQPVIADGRHANEVAIATQFKNAMAALWDTARPVLSD
jgi:formimidoylglutamate deiminase